MEEFYRENLFWREVASCYCDDLSLTLSSTADHFRSREIGFFYRVNCAKRTSAHCGPTSCFALLPSTPRATWMTMWSGFPLNLHYLFSNCLLFRHQQENWTKDFWLCNSRCLSSTCDSADLSKTSRHFSNHFFLISCTLFNFVVLPKSHFDPYDVIHEVWIGFWWVIFICLDRGKLSTCVIQK